MNDKNSTKKGDKKNTPPKKSRILATMTSQFLAIVFIIVAVSFLYSGNVINKSEVKNPSISEIAQQINEGNVTSIAISGGDVNIIYTDETMGKTKKEIQSSFIETLRDYGVTVEALASVEYRVEQESGFAYWLKILLPFLFPIILLGLIIWFMFRQTKGSGMQVFSFGKSKARYIDPNNKENRVTFKDVAGAKEAKQELIEFIDFLKTPLKYINVGAKIPKGVLLTGSPGTGKTLLARAVAGEAKVPFYTISGSEFVEMFVGVGASRVRDLFETAKKTAPSVIFIDEIDAVGRSRGSGMGGGHDEREQALNQILVEMDGFVPNDEVIVIAASNRPEILDTALLRPGRFDRKVVIDLPDMKDRVEILKVHSRGKKLADDIDLLVVARRTSGMSGADLASVFNEAAILTIREGKKILHQKELLLSIEKVLIGPERKSHILSNYEKRVAAYHEAGHALLATVLPHADPVQKISIISRGYAHGYVVSAPDEDKKLHTKQQFTDDITMALGGYVAEKIIFGDVSTGPSSDLSKVTEMAHNMVTQWGMSDKIGPIILRRSYASTGAPEEHSEELEQRIDAEISKIINGAYKKAQTLLKKYRTTLDAIVEKLLVVETMEREEFEELIKGRGIKIQSIKRQLT